MCKILPLLKNLQVIRLTVQHKSNAYHTLVKSNLVSALVKLQSSSSQYRKKSVIIEFEKGAGEIHQPFEKRFESDEEGVFIIPEHKNC